MVLCDIVDDAAAAAAFDRAVAILTVVPRVGC